MRVSARVWTLDEPADSRFRYQQDFPSMRAAVQYLRRASTGRVLVLDRAYVEDPDDTFAVAIPWSAVRVVEIIALDV
jgi:hypothetical protein